MKYWPIFIEDPIIGNLVAKNPQITYKKAGSIGGRLMQSEYRGETRDDPCNVVIAETGCDVATSAVDLSRMRSIWGRRGSWVAPFLPPHRLMWLVSFAAEQGPLAG